MKQSIYYKFESFKILKSKTNFKLTMGKIKNKSIKFKYLLFYNMCQKCRKIYLIRIMSNIRRFLDIFQISIHESSIQPNYVTMI